MTHCCKGVQYFKDRIFPKDLFRFTKKDPLAQGEFIIRTKQIHPLFQVLVGFTSSDGTTLLCYYCLGLLTSCLHSKVSKPYFHKALRPLLVLMILLLMILLCYYCLGLLTSCLHSIGRSALELLADSNQKRCSASSDFSFG